MLLEYVFRVNCWVLLEMAKFILSNLFLGVGKHHVLGKNYRVLLEML